MYVSYLLLFWVLKRMVQSLVDKTELKGVKNVEMWITESIYRCSVDRVLTSC